MTTYDWSAIGDAKDMRRRGLFVAEGRLVVERVLANRERLGIDFVRVLATPAAVEASQLECHAPGRIDVKLPHEMADVTGVHFHRGVVAVVTRPTLPGAEALLAGLQGAGPLVVAVQVADADNVGSILRNARSFGAAGVLLDSACADPLYRKSVRTSMGAVLDLPWTVVPVAEIWNALRTRGYRTVALTPQSDAALLAEVLAAGGEAQPVAIVVGNEGLGLDAASLAVCDVRARIPMAEGADSINVAAALAVALYEIRRSQT